MCFEVPIKRGLMALVRAQEEALDFKRLQLRWQLRLNAGLRRTRAAVSSVCLTTAAQGLQLDIARRLRRTLVYLGQATVLFMLLLYSFSAEIGKLLSKMIMCKYVVSRHSRYASLPISVRGTYTKICSCVGRQKHFHC